MPRDLRQAGPCYADMKARRARHEEPVLTTHWVSEVCIRSKSCSSTVRKHEFSYFWGKSSPETMHDLCCHAEARQPASTPTAPTSCIHVGLEANHFVASTACGTRQCGMPDVVRYGSCIENRHPVAPYMHRLGVCAAVSTHRPEVLTRRLCLRARSM
jgi:hypothetical protein